MGTRGVMSWRARLTGMLALCLLAAAVGGCGGSSAKRSPVDPTERMDTVGEFGKHGSGAGDFTEPFGIAVDHRTGDVYVVDTNNSRVEKFTSAGAFLLGWGWGVADGRTAALQTCYTTCFAGMRGGGMGELDFAEGVAVDNVPSSQSYGDVYVVEIQNGRVEKFSPTGKFLLMFGAGVNQTARRDHDRGEEDVCPVRRGDVCGKGSEGPAGGALEFAVEGTFIAVGSGGEVYLGQRNCVKVFSADGVYRQRIGLTPTLAPTESHELGGVSALAVNAGGDMYAVRNGIVGVHEYGPSGQPIRVLEPGGAPAYPEGPTPSLALDPEGDIFVDVYTHERHRIDEFSTGGSKVASFDQGPTAPPGVADKEDGLPGMAYDPSTGRLYVVNADINVTPLVERVRVVALPRL
jgi:tripartite motif-containing protein 71